MTSLEDQLSTIFSRGLGASTEEERASLMEALSSLGGGLDGGKSTKQEANYRPADGKESCGNCRHFSAGECDVVSGHVEKDHVSDLYEPAEDTGE